MSGSQGTSGPKVSVVIPAHNAAPYIAETIDSARAQTYGNIEIIVVDDGSTDATKSALEPYVARGDILYLYQECSRQAAARNNGIRHATGELIAFLDADDVWLPGKLAAQVPLFADPEVGLVYANAVFWDGSAEWPHAHEKAFTRGRIFDHLMAYGNFIWASTAVVRRSVLDAVGPFKEGEGFYGIEDYHMWLRIASRYKADYTGSVLEKYRVVPGSASSDILGMLRKEIAVKEDIVRIIPVPEPLRRRSFANLYWKLCYHLAEAGAYDECAGYLKKLMALEPFSMRTWKMRAKCALRKAVA